jgi:hypothetical protein
MTELTDFAIQSNGPFSYVAIVDRFYYQVTVELIPEDSPYHKGISGRLYGPRTISKRPLVMAS